MSFVKTIFIGTFALAVAIVAAQTPARDQLTRGKAFWDQRLAKSAISSLRRAMVTYSPSTIFRTCRYGRRMRYAGSRAVAALRFANSTLIEMKCSFGLPVPSF